MRLSSITYAIFSASASIATLTIAAPAVAQSQAKDFSLPSMPLADALNAIAERTGTKIVFDPDAVKNVRSAPVRTATSAQDATQQATTGSGLEVTITATGSLMVANDIVVTAVRDEAETNLVVRQTSTSSRLGQSLRDQARNAQVITAKQIAQQQSQTVADVLRSAGGVSLSLATVQSGAGYSVRGAASGGITNGLLGATNNNGVAVGNQQSVANIERVEVLKGPDALLAGTDNLGGTINIVTKKPSADPYLYLSAEGGSFGHVRGTIDATNAINDSSTLSARVIATAAHDWSR